MTSTVLRASELAQALGLCHIDVEDIVIDTQPPGPIDYSLDSERDDDEIRETCGFCEESIAIMEQLAGKSIFDMTDEEREVFGERAVEIEFSIRTRARGRAA